jgi:hypothetical protein
MEKMLLEKIFARNQSFFKARSPRLYGNKTVRLKLESHYTGFEGMLKREIAYCKYEVWERVCECRSVVTDLAFETRIAHFPKGFSEFLVRRERLKDQGGAGRAYGLVLPGFEGEVSLTLMGENAFTLKAAMRIRPSAATAAEAPLLDVELSRWLQDAADEWTKGLQNRRMDLAREAVGGAVRIIQGAWRRISQIDIDASGEAEPHAFRWKEAELFAQARFAQLSEAECAAILKENGVEAPAESRFVGILPFEIDDKSACVLLRYEHVLPDPAAEPSSPWVAPGYAGLIAAENDFWEFHIDAGARKLIGENRKWRDVTAALSQAGQPAFTL